MFTNQFQSFNHSKRSRSPKTKPIFIFACGWVCFLEDAEYYFNHSVCMGVGGEGEETETESENYGEHRTRTSFPFRSHTERERGREV